MQQSVPVEVMLGGKEKGEKEKGSTRRRGEEGKEKGKVLKIFNQKSNRTYLHQPTR